VASGDRWAGAEVQVATLLRALAERGDLALSAILLNEGRLAQELRSGGIPVIVFPESQLGFLAILRKAGELLRRKPVQVLHSHRYKENLLAAWLARRCGVPVVVRSQHGRPEPFSGWRHLKQRILQFTDRQVARWATDAVIGVSQQLAEQMRQRAGSSNVVLIRNGIAVDRVDSALTPAQAKARLGVPADALVVGCAARLEPIKRLDLFLEAAHRISAQHPQTRFVLVGEGKEERPLRDLAHKLGLTGRVMFTGHRDDVYDVMRAMDVLLLTSDHEGLPMVLLEAQCLGVPVVARCVGGVAEVLRQDAGILVDSSDPAQLAQACGKLLSDSGMRSRLGTVGREAVREFDVRKSATEVARLYFSLCRIPEN
jgi:glycosyltransferase involved in cell wall biosynthesis